MRLTFGLDKTEYDLLVEGRVFITFETITVLDMKGMSFVFKLSFLVNFRVSRCFIKSNHQLKTAGGLKGPKNDILNKNGRNFNIFIIPNLVINSS